MSQIYMRVYVCIYIYIYIYIYMCGYLKENDLGYLIMEARNIVLLLYNEVKG